ncbi:MAG: translation initiation factor IF-2 [Acidimicrobiales bacterium]|nr:translation initiation factor IF-2 [Acidimicrobiales bacterium]
MTENDNKSGKPLGPRGGGDRSHVRQSFSHGRTKSVVVEKKRKRVVVPKPGTAAPAVSTTTPASTVPSKGKPVSKRPAGISDAEMERRLQALKAAKAREADETALREEEARKREEEREEKRAELEAKEREDQEREERLRAKEAEEAKKQAREAAKTAAAEQSADMAIPVPATDEDAKPSASRQAPAVKKSADRPAREEPKKPQRTKDDDRRRSGKLTINQALAGREGGRQRSMAAMKRAQERERRKAMGDGGEREKIMRDVQIPEAITVQELANRMAERVAAVVKTLMQNGIMATQNQAIDADTAELVVEEFGHRVVRVSDADVEDAIDTVEDAAEDLKPRAPVITIMGHVDHGKTSLLDAIRKTSVVSGEAGGITQHIGAYQVVKNDKPITFIDTPGHEAFTAMRARGADATDIVVLVVAADDGVMPQTIEAIDHARAAGVPIVVALNKIDRDQADPDKVLAQLAERDLVPEDWGGDTIVCQVSALQGLGIDELLDNLLVVAELEDLRANPSGRAKGVVLEAKLDAGRGPVATVLVQRGTLKVGDPLVAGPAWGRVRALINDKGEQVKEAGPSAPVQVLGLSDVAAAGDDFVVAKDERSASKVAEQREHYHRMANISGSASVVHGGAKLEDIFSQIQAGEVATLNLIVKADVTGSLEAVTASLKRLERDEVKLSFVRQGVGGILKSDIELALASNATIIGFNVRPDRQIRELADSEDVEIRTYEVIYHLLEDIESAMVGMLAPEFEEVVTGEAEVREIFSVPKVGKIAGCYVTNGQITRGSKVRFLREGTIIWKGAINSLRRFKDDVREVNQGFECGIGLTDFQDLKDGDIIETYEDREIPRN